MDLKQQSAVFSAAFTNNVHKQATLMDSCYMGCQQISY